MHLTNLSHSVVELLQERMSSLSWPWQYDFPPFFTLQKNLGTREKQLEAWASLVLDYCQHNKIYTLDVIEAQQSPLFSNTRLNRKLPTEGVYAVLEYLEKRKHVEWLDKEKKRCHIYWRTPEEWGKQVYDWVAGNGLLNSVCTIHELVQGDDTISEPFYGLDKSVLIKALQHLQAHGRAELMSVVFNVHMAEKIGAFLSKEELVEEGDEVVIYVKFGVAHSIKVRFGQTLQTHFGALRHDFLVGKQLGSKIPTTKGYVYVLRPTPEIWTQILQHRTQILYTPDISLIVILLELKPGSVVLEAGTGSGALSHALARTLYPGGHLHTFDVEEKRVEAARSELTEHGFGSLVSCSLGDVCSAGFGMKDVADAVFLDLPKPWEAVESVREALKESGGRFCSFSPCIEQTQKTCEALRFNGFCFLETVECVPRQLKMTESKMTLLQPKSKTEKRQDGSPEAKKMKRDSEEELVKFRSVVPYPPQQPTHTGYLTSATLPRKKRIPTAPSS